MMGDCNRITGRAVAIDYRETHSFFESRGQRQYQNQLSATMYSDADPVFVVERDRVEKALLASRLDLKAPKNALDIGCGIGRWAWFLAQENQDLKYLGVDFSESLIDAARKQASELDLKYINFQKMSATELDVEQLLVTGPFDLILISGLLLYLNDADCLLLLEKLGSLLSSDGKIYIREPLGICGRFTLDKFYSAELEAEYSAIYRGLEEFEGMLGDALIKKNLQIEMSGSIFDQSLEKRKETRQFYFLVGRVEKGQHVSN